MDRDAEHICADDGEPHTVATTVVFPNAGAIGAR
jgi:hypothetical protein